MTPASSMAQGMARRRDESAMPDTCTITHTAAGTLNDDNTEEPGTVTTIPDVPCRFVNALTSMREALLDMRVTAQVDAILSVPLSTAVTADDTVTYAGATWQIVGTNEGQSYRTSIALAVRKT